ncbi:alcohol dehydrogenase catalytic domain-containing protein [Novosphingobium sp. FGD1]|uniref:Alcohol dehydrogenase catalytic domain-containing protein n=1 Tax=Novosphingobium silvae TaxID=2692619 RepID=A0A7X4K840_9SPHN|nr:NAD(P)-dependent alcohol dehydrogenase [Novosphingobium silvae]MYL99741.1 alcohol dehydrogenase catalytic domain-containing protein [Novosphingobium silvae]
MKITAALATAPKTDFKFAELDLDEPRGDEILVGISAVGLCHTDIVARDQVLPIPLPAVLGHEGAGVVVRVGANVTKVVPGDHVVLTFRSCGKCARCRSGEPTYCEQALALNYKGCRADGSKSLHSHGEAISSNFFGQSSFATHALAYETNVVKVDRDIPLDLLGPLGCGVQTGAGAVLRALNCYKGSSLVIFGGGSVGLSAVLGAVIAQCSTIVVSDPKPERRALALDLGATHVIDPANEKASKVVRELTGAGADFVLDTTGAGPVMESALGCLRPHGTLGLLGVPSDPEQRLPGLASTTLMFGYTIKGIIEGDSQPDIFIPELIRHYLEGRFPFDKLVTFYDFDDINRAVQDQHDGKIVKAVLKMPQK